VLIPFQSLRSFHGISTAMNLNRYLFPNQTFHNVWYRKKGHSNATTQASANALTTELAFSGTLTGGVDARVLQAFAAIYKESLPPGGATPVTSYLNDESAAAETEAAYDNSVKHSTPNATKADDLAQWAANQVDTIADHFRLGKDKRAVQFTEQLISSQTHDTTNYNHVVKSLCNLSKQCSQVGRQDVCLRYLGRALEFESGVDSVVFAHLADEFLRIGQLERAEICYLKSREMEDDASHLQELSRKLIRVSVRRGNYESALADYNSLDELLDSPTLLTDRGTLLRKMGDLSHARKSYQLAVQLEPDRHQAIAGLAEIRKQSGKLHGAIASYNALFRQFQDLSQQSKKVYLLAKGHLLRMTGQLESSRQVLDDLVDRYPYDPEINFQLGTLMALTGQAEEGSQRIQDARNRRKVGNLADELFSLAMGIELRKSGQSLPEKQTIEDYMPEDRGLASCQFALDALLRESFQEAVELTSTASHVNKLHSDFGWTLRFHGRKRLNPEFNYKNVQPLARIAKRGYRELRAAVTAIADERFDDALVLEKRVCLLMAA
jgi:tetratricopeptide (TPR) repeat protein